MIEQLSNILAVIIYFGGPIIPLLLLTIEVGKWHQENRDPEFAEEHNHH